VIEVEELVVCLCCFEPSEWWSSEVPDVCYDCYERGELD
jgi:hypothetical protein